jgi:hypothetical protein
MALSIFTTISDPEYRSDLWDEAFSCYRELADEVVVVDGGILPFFEGDDQDFKIVENHWPFEFKWPFIGQQFTRGYQACRGDWVIHADLDFIFHQKDFGKIRQALKDYPNAPAVSFYKWQFILPHKYNLKSRLLLAVNKKAFGDRITFSGGGDLCQPQLDGKDLDLKEMPQSGVAFYNYEKLLKTKEQIMDDQGRMERAYFRHFGRYQLAENDTDESAYEGWLRMQHGRYNKPQEAIPLSSHPKYVQDTIRNLKPDQWGYSGFGMEKGFVYA